MFNTDQAVLEAGEARKDLPCSVEKPKPIMGFDLKFHAGYEVIVPLRELAGGENLLTILFRVTNRDDKQSSPVYFVQHVRVPSIEEDAKGDAFLQGSFDLGEGHYQIDWLMRDRSERVCSDFWEMEAVLPPKDKQIAMAIQPGAVYASDKEQFRDEPPVARIQEQPSLSVKMLVNFAPQNMRSATLQPLDTAALVSILRHISREPRIGKFSVVAFNLQEQKVLYRSDNAERIDFPALGQSLNQLSLGTVDLHRLGNRHGETEFLSNLLRTEVAEAKEGADAIVLAGPKAMLDENVPSETLKVGELPYPVF
ncbi:MAG TPA: acetyltransferase, partial [Bryobacteraceae bacterium]|nr:acetyltransferase [Bryobacteraceae bacterium]